MANVRYSGGRSATLGTKTIDENGVYNASSDELDGYSEVTVEVPQPSGSISLSYNANGTYSDVDVEDYEKANIQIDVPIPAVQTQEKEVFAQTNQVVVLPDSGKYLSKVIVQPQRNLNTYTPVPDTSNNDMGIINNYRYVNTQGMITPSGTKEVEYTTNGSHTEDIKNYENIDIEINVPVTGDLGSKTIIANGTYQALDDNLDGYDEIIVNVPQNATLGVKNITANGDYYASADDLDGYSRVSVAVPGGGSTLQTNKTVTATTSQQIVQPDVGYDGLQQVTVNPQEHTATYTPAADTAANDMGANNNYRYVNTSGMHITNMLVPSNTPPTYFNSGAHLTAAGNGYAITGYTDIMPSNASPVRLNSDNVYRTMSSGYAIQTYSDETPSDSTPPAITSGSIIKATANGYLYATQQGGGGSTETVLWTNNSPTSNFNGQTVSLSDDYTNYDYIEIYFRSSTSIDTEFRDIIPTSTLSKSSSLATCTIGNNANTATRSRGIYADTASSLRFTSAYPLSGSSSADSYVIPIKIVGISVALPPSVGNVKTGVITGSSGTITINCGFKPKKIFVYNYFSANKYVSATYDEDVDSTYQYRGYRSSSSSSSVAKYEIGNSASGTIQSITSTGFTYKADSTFNPLYYVAIG